MQNKKEDWDLIVKPKRALFDLDLKGVWRYRDLFKMYVKRDIITVYKQTILGPLWFFISPIFTTVMYMFVFGTLANITTGGVPQTLFYMSGTVMWSYFSACFTTGQNTFTGNQSVFSKVYFPRLVVPLSGITSGLIKTAIQFIPVIVVWFYYYLNGSPIHLTWEFLLFPVLILIVAFLGMAIGLIVSSLTIKYRDLNNLVAFALNLWMYATPVIYPVSIASGNPKIETLLRLNPLQAIFTDFRYMITGIGEMDWYGLLYSFGFTIVFLFLGIIMFNRLERNFMDTI